MVGHKVGLITDAEIPSDGLHRRDTEQPGGGEEEQDLEDRVENHPTGDLLVVACIAGS